MIYGQFMNERSELSGKAIRFSQNMSILMGMASMLLSLTIYSGKVQHIRCTMQKSAGMREFPLCPLTNIQNYDKINITICMFN